jgi:hypothetical protein
MACPDSLGLHEVIPAEASRNFSLSTGIGFDFKKIRIYADAELPVMNNVVGAQLIAPCTVKVVASLLF